MKNIKLFLTVLFVFAIALSTLGLTACIERDEDAPDIVFTGDIIYKTGDTLNLTATAIDEVDGEVDAFVIYPSEMFQKNEDGTFLVNEDGTFLLSEGRWPVIATAEDGSGNSAEACAMVYVCMDYNELEIEGPYVKYVGPIGEYYGSIDALPFEAKDADGNEIEVKVSYPEGMFDDHGNFVSGIYDIRAVAEYAPVQFAEATIRICDLGNGYFIHDPAWEAPILFCEGPVAYDEGALRAPVELGEDNMGDYINQYLLSFGAFDAKDGYIEPYLIIEPDGMFDEEERLVAGIWKVYVVAFDSDGNVSFGYVKVIVRSVPQE